MAGALCGHPTWTPFGCGPRPPSWLREDDMETPKRSGAGETHQGRMSSKLPQWKVHLPPHPSAVYQFDGVLAS